MSKCPICGRSVEKPEDMAYCLFQSETTGENVYCCSKCESQMKVMTHSEEPEKIKAAINYFYSYSDEVEDAQTGMFLMDILESNAAELLEKKEKKRQNKKQGNEVPRREYFLEKSDDEPDSTGWISALRVFAGIFFIAEVIGGIVFASSLDLGGGYTFLIIIAFTLGAFLSLAVGMVFLDMANDIHVIRKTIEKP